MIYDISNTCEEPQDLLIPVMRDGKVVYTSPPLDQIRAKTIRELSLFHPAIRRFLHPQPYLVELESSLHDLKLSMIKEATYESTSHR